MALGRLGWSLRRIEEATAVRRETVSGYLRAAGVAVRGRGGQPKEWAPKPAITPGVSTDPRPSKPAITGTVSTDPGPPSPPGRAPSASACDPHRELTAEALDRGRNAMAIWQDLVDDHGFTARYASVRRFVLTLSREQVVAWHVSRLEDAFEALFAAARSQMSRRRVGKRPICGSAECHLADLAGDGLRATPLVGDPFLKQWQRRRVGDLFKVIKAAMPADRPSSLSDAEYADITPYILKANQYPAGSQALSAELERLLRIGFESP